MEFRDYKLNCMPEVFVNRMEMLYSSVNSKFVVLLAFALILTPIYALLHADVRNQYRYRLFDAVAIQHSQIICGH